MVLIEYCMSGKIKKLNQEENQMSKQCDICQKTTLRANKVSFSHKHHTYRQEPNLQSMKTCINGTVKRIKVCTSCMKANKVQRVV